MSAIVGSPTVPAVPESPPSPQARPRAVRPWPVVLASLLILGLAGAVRAWQGGQVSSQMASGQQSPFPLEDLPAVIGPWRQTDEPGLDPAIIRGAGATDSVNRTYVDERTGVKVSVLVLYGWAMQMQLHKPEVCYPVNGYSQTTAASRHDLEYPGPDGKPRHAELLTMAFAKGEGPAAVRNLVTYTWGCQGRWSTELPNVKAFHRIPGMFKVHVDRITSPTETSESDGAAETFIRDLLTVIDTRVQAAAKAPVSTASVP